MPPKSKSIKKEKEEIPVVAVPKSKYFEAVGRRKTAIARVRLTKGTGTKVNDKDYKEYFTVRRHQAAVTAPLEAVSLMNDMSVSVKVKGGGPNAQAEAVRHGISRALVLVNNTFKKRLSRLGFMTRDSRMVERKKYGLKKARRAPQWAKR